MPVLMYSTVLERPWQEVEKRIGCWLLSFDFPRFESLFAPSRLIHCVIHCDADPEHKVPSDRSFGGLHKHAAMASMNYDTCHTNFASTQTQCARVLFPGFLSYYLICYGKAVSENLGGKHPKEQLQTESQLRLLYFPRQLTVCLC